MDRTENPLKPDL